MSGPWGEWSWLLALLLKVPVVLFWVLLFGCVVVVARLISLLVYKLLPNSAFKRWLFLPRNEGVPDGSADPRHVLSYDAHRRRPLVGWERRD